jgi:large subunit ribosomal protein L1
VQSVEFIVNLALNPKKAAEQIRVVADLPFGLGANKSTSVLAFTLNEQQALAAKQAGCDRVGGLELIDEFIQNPNLATTFQKCVCTEDILSQLQQRLAKTLGPKGLMPSRKLQTVSTDLGFAVTKAKAGQVQLRLDRGGTIHCAIGSANMTSEQLIGNLKSILLTLENNKPQAIKGKKWIKTAFMKTSMGKSFALQTETIDPKHSKFLV